MAKVLVMEDEQIYSMQLQVGLSNFGHDVETFSCASEAIEELLTTSYDLLITDLIVQRNGRSVSDGGVRLIGWVRGNPSTKTLPVIAITGSHIFPGMGNILTTVKTLGANACFEKPVIMNALLDEINFLLPQNESRSPDHIKTV